MGQSGALTAGSALAPRAGQVADALASHVVSAFPAGPSAATRHAVVRSVLDALASAAAALDVPGVIAARAGAARLFGCGGTPIWFTGSTGAPGAALFANSAATAALDLDDGHRRARGHPGAAVIPAALAMLDDAACPSSEELMAAIATGYEVGLRVAMARPAYAPSGAWSAFGVIATLGRLRGERAEHIAHALSIAAQCSPAMPALAGIAGSDVKEGIPYGCVAGLAALDMAAAGVTGPLPVFDDPDLFAAAVLIPPPGDPPLIEGTYFKPWGCCRHIHAALDALLALREATPFDTGRIAGIEVRTYRATFNLANRPDPSSLVEAQYSVPFCVAALAVLGVSALVPLREHLLRDAHVVRLAHRVRVIHDPEIEPLFPGRSPARITIALADGRRLASPLVDPRGDPARPLSWSELERKFLQATARNIDPRTQAAVLDAMERFEQGDAMPLARVIRSGGGA